MNVLLLTPAEALFLRGGDENAKLAPRQISAGPYAGSYVLPLAVMEDPEHADKAEAFALLPVVDLDTAEAWPVADV